MPLISIVTSHFERSALLKQSLAFLRASAFGDWEWLIIDDGSSAATWDQVRAMADDSRVQVLRRETSVKGASACRNFGLARVSGDYVLLLDDDDVLAPWCLEQRLAAARASPDAALWVFPVLCCSQYPGDSDRYWNTMDPAGDDLGRFLCSDGPWCISSPLWRRDAIRALGGFNEAMTYGTDSDLHIRALLAGIKVRQFPEALPDVFIRRGAEPRLTSSMSPAVMEWRRIRLEEGTRALRQAGARPEHLKRWEGQYFVEAEFLLFNVRDSAAAIHGVLADWRRHFCPSLAKRFTVVAYLRTALACRHKAYLLLRLARRAAMKLLPVEFFPHRVSNQSSHATSEVVRGVRRRLELLQLWPMLAGAASEKGSLLQRVTDAGASPTVSVITPHFERADLLRETRASIRASTRGDWEWLIIDDGSCAEVWEQVRAMADGDRVRVLRRVTGLKGPSTCRNLGVRECRGEYVIFLDSDDLLAPWCLEQRLAAARAQPDAALWVFPALLFAQAPGDGDGYWNTMNPAGDDLGRFLGSDNPWCVSSPLWRGDALRAIGGFNENLHYGDDSDLHIRALLAGLKVRQFPEALPDVFVRRGAEPRLTSSTSPAVVEWRRIRLEEGTRALRQAGARPEHLKLWEGQYFVEAEFLLFNVLDSAGAIHRVLTDWQRQFRPRLTRRAEVLAYFRLALASRKKAYLLIRIARRIAMRLLPRDFFPSRRPSPCPIVPTETMLEVKGRLCLAVSRGGHAIRR